VSALLYSCLKVGEHVLYLANTRQQSEFVKCKQANLGASLLQLFTRLAPQKSRFVKIIDLFTRGELFSGTLTRHTSNLFDRRFRMRAAKS
jgi:hypothetical protein